jgi:DnaJ-class molecular chaperone
MPDVPSTFVNCATCKGKGVTRRKRNCPACDGLGEVNVAEPTTKCPRCNGTGKAPTGDIALSRQRLCPVCGGIGWALILEG